MRRSVTHSNCILVSETKSLHLKVFENRMSNFKRRENLEMSCKVIALPLTIIIFRKKFIYHQKRRSEAEEAKEENFLLFLHLLGIAQAKEDDDYNRLIIMIAST